MRTRTTEPAPLPPELLQLQDRVIGLKEAAKLMGISPDTLRRNHSDKILVLSARRRGMRLRDALLRDAQG